MKKFLLTAGLILGAIVNANAAISLEVFEGNNLIIALGPVTGGSINVQGASTNFYSSINVTVTGSPILSSPDLSLDFSVTSASFPGTSNLTILATQTDVSPTDSLNNILAITNFSNGPNTPSQVRMANFVDAGNVAFAKTTPISPQILFTAANTFNVPGQQSPLAAFAETLMISIDAGSTSTINGTNVVAGVPEPSTWLMMLAGFIGLGLFFSRKGSRFAKLAA
jgi:hypothetical protein